MIGAEQIKENFEAFNNVLEEKFEGERLGKLQTLTECLKERMMLAPASSKDWFNNAFPGGYLDHILRVNKIANQLHKLYDFHNADSEAYTEEELNFVSLFCQLGKLGDWNSEYFTKNYQRLNTEFFEFQFDWLNRAYAAFKDFDKYLILAYLFRKTFFSYSELFKVVSFDISSTE